MCYALSTQTNHTQRRLSHEKHNTGHQVLSSDSFLMQISTASQRLPLSTVPIASSSTVCAIATMVRPNPSRRNHGAPIITPTNTQTGRSLSFVACANVVPIQGLFASGGACVKRVIHAPSQVFIDA